eukprot:c2405_g1_i1.p1 GENE.c2405_g1_i1~~c2405_g1_i1.p1  ORF type:complete len:733 (+),score=197.26 c2405_g1_i1:73-2199(+)
MNHTLFRCWSGLLFFCLIKFVFGGGLESQTISFQVRDFNYEIAYRVNDTINNFLNTGAIPLFQLQALFRLKATQSVDNQALMQLVFTEMVASPNVLTLIVGFLDGSGLGYTTYVDGSKLQFSTDETSGAQTCDGDTNGVSPTTRCLIVSHTDAQGRPASVMQAFTIDYLTYPRFQQMLADTQAMTQLNNDTINYVNNTIINNSDNNNNIVGFWSDTTPLDLTDAGTVFSVALTNKLGQVIGIASATIPFSLLEHYLVNHFKFSQNSTWERSDGIVFVANRDWDMVGASVPDVTMIQSLDVVNNVTMMVPVKANASLNEHIRRAAKFAISLTEADPALARKLTKDSVMYIHDSLFIQLTIIERAGLFWNVVVVRPANPRVETLQSKYTTTFVIIMLIATAGLLTTLFLMHWIYANRNMKLWEYAYPKFLALMLISHVLCYLFLITLAMTSKVQHCHSQLWFGTIGFTLAGAAVLCRILVLDPSIIFLELPRHVKTQLKTTLCVVLLQVAIVVLETTLPGSVRMQYFYKKDNNNTVVIQERCVYRISVYLLSVAIPLIISLVCVLKLFFQQGTILNHKSKGTGYNEKSGLKFASVQALILYVVLGVVNVLDILLDMETRRIVLTIAVAWYIVAVQSTLIVPRIYRQMTAGDLTIRELRELISSNNNKSNTNNSSGLNISVEQRQQQQWLAFPMQCINNEGSNRALFVMPD